MEDPALNDAFDKILAKLHIQKREKGKNTFLFCGIQPSVGTTTVAINLAIATSLSGWKTLFIDADLRKGAEHKRLIGEKNKQLGDYLAGRAEEEELYIGTNYPNLTSISGSRTVESPTNLFCSERLSTLISAVKKKFDFIMVDAPSPLAAADASLIGPLTDGVVLVAKWDITKTGQIQQVAKDFQDSGSSIMGIIANQVGDASYKRINRNYSYFIKRDYIKNVKKGIRIKNG